MREPLHLDMVFCVDATGSMRHVIDLVRENALNLYADLMDTLQGSDTPVASVRVRIIAFRDYLADGENAMLASRFFTLPEEARDFYACVDGIHPQGGGDIPEDGLEALGYAIRSEWDRSSPEARHLIVMWSDAPTHELGFGKASPFYPAGMAKDFKELSLWWGEGNHGGMDPDAKRLLLFAPDDAEWNRVAAEWDNVIHVQSVKNGLSDLEYRRVLCAITDAL